MIKDKKSEKIHVTNTTNITIQPLDQKLSYDATQFTALCTTCNFDNQEITVYSAKYKSKKRKGKK